MIAILAGGQGKRYGKDKIIELVDGRRVIDRLLEEFPDAVVITTSEDRCKLYSATRCLIDKGKGPGEVMASLEGEITFVPGDMPFVTREMVERLEAYRRVLRADVAVPLHANGFMESLLLSANLDSIDLSFTGKLGRSLRATDLIRFSARRAFVGSKLISPYGINFSHLNSPIDLRLRAPKSPLGEGLIILEGEFRPCKDLMREIQAYEELGLAQLRAHALKDLKICK